MFALSISMFTSVMSRFASIISAVEPSVPYPVKFRTRVVPQKTMITAATVATAPMAFRQFKKVAKLLLVSCTGNLMGR